MVSVLGEVERNLRTVGQFDLADSLASEWSPLAEAPRVLEYTRYLIVLNGYRSSYAARIRAEIIAALRGFIDNHSSAEQLRLAVLICAEELVRECSDIKGIHYQLEALAAVYGASLSRSSDLQELIQLVRKKDFDKMRGILPPPDTHMVVDVIGRAYRYYKYGDMNVPDYAEVLEESELQLRRRGEPVDGLLRGPAKNEHSRLTTFVPRTEHVLMCFT